MYVCMYVCMYVWNCSYSLKQSSHISFSYLQCTHFFFLHRTTGYLVIFHHLRGRSIKFIERLNRNMNKNRSGWSMVIHILLNPSIGREGGREGEGRKGGFMRGVGMVTIRAIWATSVFTTLMLITPTFHSTHDVMMWLWCACEFVCKLICN